MNAVGQAALLVSFPVAAGAIGSTVAAVRRPGSRLVSGIQHFAAGVVIAALAGELLPDLRHEGNLGWVAAGFTAGVVLVLSLAAYGRRLDGKQESTPRTSTGDRVAATVPIGLLVTAAIDLLVDGVLVGLGAQLGSTQALILTIALTLEILFLSLSLAAELNDRGLSARRAALICTALGMSTAVGAIAAAAILSGVGTRRPGLRVGVRSGSVVVPGRGGTPGRGARRGRDRTSRRHVLRWLPCYLRSG